MKDLFYWMRILKMKNSLQNKRLKCKYKLIFYFLYELYKKIKIIFLYYKICIIKMMTLKLY